MKRLLVLGAAIFSIPIIQKAKNRGLYVGVVDINEDAPGVSFADEYIKCSIRDYDKLLDVSKRFRPDGIIIGACDTPVMAAARVCEELGLPGNSVETAYKSTEKVAMLKAFDAMCIAHPRFRVIKKDNIENVEADMALPVITKPIDSAGGRGVCIVHKREEYKNALRYSSNAGVSGDVLVEEYMVGPEVSVEVIVSKGKPYVIQITDKITSGEPYFYEVGHSQPSNLPVDVKNRIKELAKDAVLAVGIKNGPAHVEIINTDDGPKMVELGARMGADCITSYLIDTSVSGIDMIDASIDLALRKEPNMNEFHDSGVCSGVRFIPAKEGTLKTIQGIELLKENDGIVRIEILGKEGCHYSKATNNSERFGFVVCKGETTKEALDCCESVIKRLEFETE